MYDYQNSVYDYLTSGDSVSYNHFVVNTVPKIEFIGGIEQSSNSGAYAIMVPMYPVCWRLNSIQIIGLGNGATEDLTDKFLVHIRNGENNPFEITNDQAFRNRFTQEFVSTYSRLEFKLKEVPAIRTEQVLKFIFTNQDGSTWTLDTDPIVITP
ncbi:MAG: hypothetical protein COA58_14415 [Bacteroidetes bacterium]|nr:MAG: hypothetical protein COA58_14415 [Bacteroidota bacterium]